MGEPDELDDWELLPSPDAALCLSPNFKGIDADNGRIKSDYFALDSGDRYAKSADTDAEAESFACSGRPGDGFQSGESSGGEKGGIFREEDAESDLGFQGAASKEAAAGETDWIEGIQAREEKPRELESGGSARMENGSGEAKSEACFDGIDAGNQNFEGENEEIEGREMGGGITSRLESGESARMEDRDGSSVEVNEGGAALEKTVSVWLKMPLDLLKLCVLRVRPVWSISIAAGIVGILMLGRRLYNMKRKSRSIHRRVRMDDKKASQLIIHAARVNEAFSLVRRAPIITYPPPAGGVTLWPVAGLL